MVIFVSGFIFQIEKLGNVSTTKNKRGWYLCSNVAKRENYTIFLTLVFVDFLHSNFKVVNSI